MIESTVDLFGRTHKEVTIELDLASVQDTVDADHTQIEQVILNLCINAWHAMLHGGRLSLSTRNTVIDGARAKQWEVVPGPYVQAAIADTGHGMDEETRLRVFDPFFTTKARGKGSGLGLAAAYGIVRNHGGIITVQSEPGGGSCFFVHLPLSASLPAEQVEEGNGTGIEQGSGTIMLVDDEEMILEVGCALLERLGYTVLPASGGAEAVEIFKGKHAEIDLVILDVVMPVMGGRETYGELVKISPDAKVLLASGHSREGQAEELLDAGCCGFLSKPFRLQALAKTVNGLLAGDDG